MRTKLAILLILALYPAVAFAKFDPSFVWSTLETPHFLIHFHQGEEEIVRRAAVIAEDVHDRLAPRIKWEPKDKTRLVLVDAMDEANGSASPVPYNEVIVFLTRPAGLTGLGSTAFDDWLRTVITHEYTHILQLDMVTSGPATLQKVLGRIYFPNLFQPIWMIEGLAVYEETEETAGGRGRSPGSEMVLRMASLANAFPTLDQMAVFPDPWPAGQVPYLFGESFNRFIAEKYGREKLADVSVAYSGRRFPFLVGSTGQSVLHEKYLDLWYEWRQSLRERYEEQEKQIRAAGVTESRRLTNSGFVTTGPVYSPDGTRIAYAAAEADAYPGIFIMNSDGSRAKKLVENVFPGSASGTTLSWSADGTKLYYTKIEIVRNTGYYSDLYACDLATGKEQRLTDNLRARDANISPDGKQLVFVMNRLGMTRLCVLDMTAERRKPAMEQDVRFLSDWSADQYETPRWSPDGTGIAVAVRKPGGVREIAIVGGNGAPVGVAINDRANNGAPFWGPDGKTLYFSSDRSGVFNIYAYDLDAKELRMVTNVLGGAFDPAVSPDGKNLVFSEYSVRGYDIHAMALDPAMEKPAAPFVDPYPVMQYADKPVETTIGPYSPWSTIYPRFWIPWFGSSGASGTMLGALTFGQDAVQRHQYVATAFYGPKNGRVWYGLDYFYDGLYPTIHLEASDNDVTYGNFLENSQGAQDYVERDRVAGLSLEVPLLRNAEQQVLVIGCRRREVSHLTDLPPWTGYTGPLPAEGTLASARVDWIYNSSRRYALSISPEDGRTVEFGAKRFDDSIGSDFTFTKYTADWREYAPLPFAHQVLLLRGFAGAATGEAPPQGAFQLGGDNPGDVTITMDDQAVTLRGYPANVMHGQKSALAGAEYRFPIDVIEHGANTGPFYSRKLHGALFYEAGSAWDGTLHEELVRKSVGGEMRFDVTFAYYLPITLRMVFAKGLDRDGMSQIYFNLWLPMGL